MSELFLVRHAQASFGTENYDRLSDIGHRQSRWLGEYFAARGLQFDLVMSGTMQRHLETTAGILGGMGHAGTGVRQHPEWDEFDFLKLLALYARQYPDRRPPASDDERQALYRQLHTALLAWASGDLDCDGAGLERWAHFQDRVGRILETIRGEQYRNVLVVSSGGALAVAMQHVIGTSNASTIQLNLQTRNTGMHHCYFNGNGISLSSFNNVPHLEIGERRQYITYA